MESSPDACPLFFFLLDEEEVFLDEDSLERGLSEVENRSNRPGTIFFLEEEEERLLDEEEERGFLLEPESFFFFDPPPPSMSSSNPTFLRFFSLSSLPGLTEGSVLDRESNLRSEKGLSEDFLVDALVFLRLLEERSSLSRLACASAFLIRSSSPLSCSARRFSLRIDKQIHHIYRYRHKYEEIEQR